jgi:hypothetical protein
LLPRDNMNRLTASQMQMLGIGGGTGSTINQLMNNSHNNITRNESNTSGGNLQNPIDQVQSPKDNAEGNEDGQFPVNNNEELGFEDQ